jgi:UDP-N-acetyl-D-glucosamine dehydrogenase
MNFFSGALPNSQLDPAGLKLERKIQDRTAQVGVIGLGYVGLPLAVEMARAGFEVTGIDIDGTRVESINAGISYVPDVPNEALLSLVLTGALRATQSLATVENLDAISISVPTPLRKTKDPELSYVIAAVEAVRNHLRVDQLISLESTTYPGTTREVVLPILEGSGLKVGSDFFLVFSPERVDPGNANYRTANIPKVIGGITPRCTELGSVFYGQFIQEVVPVSTAESAEMVKLLENTFRSVNIALANEIALACHNLGINVWEVIEAAKTKPFGFMPFYPGPGLGGHCIPVDPHYLIWRAKMQGFEPRLIELASLINSQMPGFTVSRIADALNKSKKSLNGSHILALGISYKRDTNDIRESPSLEVVKELHEKGAIVSYSDPHVLSIELDGKKCTSQPTTPEVLKSADCVVILTDHSAFDFSTVAAHSRLVLDCRNALRNCQGSNVIPL